jgi:hypothetical protein
MDLVKKVETLLRNSPLRPDDVNLDGSDGIIGWVVSKRFEGLESIDRMNMLWDILDAGLTKEERRRIVMIVAATPVEAIAHSVLPAPRRKRTKARTK